MKIDHKKLIEDMSNGVVGEVFNHFKTEKIEQASNAIIEASEVLEKSDFIEIGDMRFRKSKIDAFKIACNYTQHYDAYCITIVLDGEHYTFKDISKSQAEKYKSQLEAL